MIKKFSFFVIAVLFCMAVYAQNIDSVSSRKPAFSKGDISIFGGSVAASLFKTYPGANLNSYMNSVVIGARDQLTRHTSLGLLASWAYVSSCTDHVVDGTTGNTICAASQRRDIFNFLVSYENFWLNRGDFVVYSGIDVGVMIYSQKVNITNGVTASQLNGIYGEGDGIELNEYGGIFNDNSKTVLIPGIQLHLVGFKYKPIKNLAIFGDIGIGTVGVIYFGAQYNIN